FPNSRLGTPPPETPFRVPTRNGVSSRGSQTEIGNLNKSFPSSFFGNALPGRLAAQLPPRTAPALSAWFGRRWQVGNRGLLRFLHCAESAVFLAVNRAVGAELSVGGQRAKAFLELMTRLVVGSKPALAEALQNLMGGRAGLAPLAVAAAIPQVPNVGPFFGQRLGMGGGSHVWTSRLRRSNQPRTHYRIL